MSKITTWIICWAFMANHQAHSMNLNNTILALFDNGILMRTTEDTEVLPECEELLKPHDQSMCDKHIALYFEKLRGLPSIGWPSWAFKSNEKGARR